MKVGRRGLLAVMAIALVSAGSSSLFAAPAEATTQYHFCEVTLAKYGQYGDRCNAWGGGIISKAEVQAWEHSACIDFTNGYTEALLFSWACTGPPIPQLGYNWRYVELGNDGVYRKAIIRNNTTGDTTKVAGVYNCYYPC